MLIKCPACSVEYDLEPGRYQCQCSAIFEVSEDGESYLEEMENSSFNMDQTMPPQRHEDLDDMDQTMPPQRHRGMIDSDDDRTMPGKRDRKPDGRFHVGDLILDRYKVLAELGQGGMGVVYKCFDETAGIEVALKALPPELSHNTLEMEDIKDNFQLIHNLHHPNIASSNTLEKDRTTGNYYLIMECCEGEDLRHWIRRKRKENTLNLALALPVI